MQLSRKRKTYSGFLKSYAAWNMTTYLKYKELRYAKKKKKVHFISSVSESKKQKQNKNNKTKTNVISGLAVAKNSREGET